MSDPRIAPALSALGLSYLSIILALALAGCGRAPGPDQLDVGPGQVVSVPAIDVPSADGLVVKGRAIVPVASSAQTAFNRAFSALLPSAYAANGRGGQEIDVTNSASVSFKLDPTYWNVPSIRNEVLDFGSLAIAELSDNEMKSCGEKGKSRCRRALIRIYTTGQKGEGVWNDEDGYGAPLTASAAKGEPGTVGLEVEGAYTLQSYEIAKGQNVISGRDLGEKLQYNVSADFRNAGAGHYATTLVIEYVLGE